MIYILLSICCSVVVSIMLKLARRYHIDVYQAITWNYSMAIFLSWIFLKPQLQNLKDAPFFSYSLLALLLPALFVILATSVRLSGIVRTDIAQRLSLLVPVIAAFFLFGEQITVIKLIGIILGFTAIICSIPWQNKNAVKRKNSNAWVYLLIVFAGMGLIDVLFKQIAAFTLLSYGTSLFIVFVLAFIFAFTGLIFQVLNKTMRFSWPHIFIGWVLGVANFGNILFYLKAHKALANQPSTVFSAMNIGVVVVGALIGMLIFKEKLSLLNKAGIVIAIIAIVIMAQS
ncbi:EamA-like transporter family protein [Mucilaginibacter frigoritolerans]|uniref:EamA-like transporter family protein n=1 Tax=Mucilaginibacter frigoritolerans TaxID=652788 RepID=A0A562TWZ6_9SPHI|nr:EamA family transporter [Mucilaginibacter frigoritolerans]TWI98057.1 EamA-like transporter family protein [Mucilaginibacter frigoritolerans]